jgi:hypothetical protein
VNVKKYFTVVFTATGNNDLYFGENANKIFVLVFFDLAHVTAKKVFLKIY